MRKDPEIGEGRDDGGGSGGAASPAAGRGGAPVGGVSTGGVFIGVGSGGRKPTPVGEAGQGGAALGEGGAGGTASAGAGSFGDGGETEPCGPLDAELIEASELDQSSWVSEETCDAEAKEAAKRFASYDDDAKIIDVGVLAGKWSDGSGSTRIDLVLDAVGESTLKFGDVSLPALDVEAAYLTGIDERDPSRIFDYSRPALVRGFPYTLIAGQWQGDELSFTFRLTEPWEEWCAAQPPVRGAYCYSCAATGSRSAQRDETCGELRGCFTFEELSRQVRLDCGRVALCQGGACWCSKAGCRSNPQAVDWASVRIDPTDPDVIRIDRDAFGEATRYLQRQ